MPARRILFLARVMRWNIAASDVRNALAISAVASPPRVRRVKATRPSGERDGWQQVNIKRSRSSATLASICSIGQTASSSTRSDTLSANRRRRRSRSIPLCRATVSSQAAGFAGVPLRGQLSTALATASAKASSATSKSAKLLIRDDKTRPCSRRKISSRALAGVNSTSGPHRSYLDDRPPDRRNDARIGEGLVKIFGLDDVEAAKLFFRVGIWPVGHDDPAVNHPDGGGGI